MEPQKKKWPLWAKILGGLVLLVIIGNLMRKRETEPVQDRQEGTSEAVVDTAPNIMTVMTNVRTLVKSNLAHPDTYEMDQWGEIVPISDSTYVIFLKYTAENTYGVPVNHNQLFYLNKDGSIYDVKDNK